MKIRIGDRIILFLGGIISVLAGAFMIAQGVLLLSLPAGSLADAPAVLSLSAWNWVEIALGIVVALLGVYLVVFPRRHAYRKHDFVVQQIENGELRIAIKAIENLVQKCIDMHPEIHMDSMQVHNAREGVVIELRISLANNISIPLAVASLQKQIKQYLVASSGIDVREVRVSVETAETATENSPYLVPNEPNGHAAAEKASEQKDSAKPALHRRIFGRSEQPVTVPEAPAAEEEPTVETAPEEAPVEEVTIEAEPVPETIETEAPAAVEEVPAQEEDAEDEEKQEGAENE